MANKKNLKGFILVETMVVIAFLATTLLTVYSSFTTVLDNAKTRIFYDDPIYLYRTYYFLSYLEKNNLPEFIDSKFNNTSGTDNRSLSIVEFGCNALSVTEASGGASESGFCESLKSNMDINHVFIMNYDVNDVIKCDEQSGNLDDKTLYCQRNKALQNLSISAVNYLYTLDGYTGSSTPNAVRASGYRIVMEFRKAKTATYQYFDYNKSTTNKETMQETTYDYYYATLKVPYGYDNRSKEDAIFRKTYKNDTFAYKDPTYADKIRTITFNRTLSDTTGAVKVWDIGVEPGTLQAYIKNSPTYSGYYDLYIEGKDKIYTNSDSSYLFASLSEVEEINNIDVLDTSYTRDMNHMFAVGTYSSRLKNLDLRSFDTSNVVNMSYMFEGRRFLETLDVSSFDTRSVTDMSGMFYSNYKLTTLNVSNFNTSKVVNMSNMFRNCIGLTSLNLSNFDTRNVTNMRGMFAGLMLTTLDLSNFNTSKVTNMAQMFSTDLRLTSLNLSNFDTRNVTDMSEMFMSCKFLTNLNISSFNTMNVKNMHGMFSALASMTSLNLSNFDTRNVVNMSEMFALSNKITYLNVSSFNTSNVTTMAGMFWGMDAIPSLNLGNFDTHNVTDMSGMFAMCTSLRTLNVSSFDTSKVVKMGSVVRTFYYKNGVIDDWDMMDYGGMFEHCSSLTSLDLSNFRTDKVTDMGGMFAHCIHLTWLNISKFITQSVTNMDVMFYNTWSLSTIYASSFDVSRVTTMEGMFARSRLSGFEMNRTSFKSNVNLKQFVNNGQVMSLVVRTQQDKILFDKMGFSRLTVTVKS